MTRRWCPVNAAGTILLISMLLCGMNTVSAEPAPEPYIPASRFTAPVVHAGRWHVLTAGATSVVLDGANGMSIARIIRRNMPGETLSDEDALITRGALTATLTGDDGTVRLSQCNDSGARLEIIDQGSGRAAARVYFTLADSTGRPFGSGTLGIYLSPDRLHLTPSMFIDNTPGFGTVSRAGFIFAIPGRGAQLIARGQKVIPSSESRFIPFGEDDEAFDISVSNPPRGAMRMGWLRTTNPSWLYMRNTAENPETDELYEQWPHWITQRGRISWNAAPGAGCGAVFNGAGLERVTFNWANGDTLAVPDGGYTALNGLLAVFLGDTTSDAQTLWKAHESPEKPTMKAGEFKYYNEIEGVYEIDSLGDDVDVVLGNESKTHRRDIMLRIWNLEGRDGYDIRINGRPVPFTLLNDGDVIRDPMVPVVKEASGPARTALVPVSVKPGGVSRITLQRKPGIQFTYQMYSGLETYEAWSSVCTDSPLFRLYLTRGAIHHATLPGKNEYAFFKLPVYWLRNGLNRDTFMYRLRGFTVGEQTPDALSFTFEGVDLQGTGRSSYTVTVPYEQDFLTFDIHAAFESLADVSRWSRIEYCDLYPFDHVYRRGFHYDDVYFLTSEGEFNRVGTGACRSGFKTVEEPKRLGYYGEPEPKDGPGRTVPGASDGTVWILGDNPARGNVIYRRGEWTSSPGARSVFSLCNAWVDVHNTIFDRENPSAPEEITYTVQVFPGKIPSVERLSELYHAASGGEVKRVTGVEYSSDGAITGFVTGD